MLTVTVVLCFVLSPTWSYRERDFPPGFKFGASTSSYQIEGGWNAADKTESIWDVFTHEYPEKITDGSNGDIACDSYNQWERDIEMCAELGLDFYRFSISWPRLLPTGYPNKISVAGKKYYDNLIDYLLARGIEPVITLYHWDLPQSLQKLGGWTNPKISDWFANYARVAFMLFGDRVKTWITINEPLIICDYAYNTGALAPGITDPGVSNYICNKHVLIAHAKAYRIYDKEFRSRYQGEVGITNQLLWVEPETKQYKELAEMLLQLGVGMYSHAIYSKEGGWPPSIEKYIAIKSIKEGFKRSRLPAFTKQEKELVRGTYDFYGFNHYTSHVAREAKPGEVLTNDWPIGDAPELNAKLRSRPGLPIGDAPWFAIYPEGIRYMLGWVKKQYGDVKILITENGYFTNNKTLHDVERIQYYKGYLEQVLLAIKEDHVNVAGYSAWSLMDNFEWGQGYTVNFGLYNVDFNDPARPRTPRASALYYASVIQHHSLDIYSQDHFNY